MEDLINEFIAETREMLEALGGAIVAWEAAPDDRARLDEIFRFVHTVKGNCGFFDLPRLEKLSHAAEDVLAEVRAGRRIADHALVSAVLAVVDRIGELVQALETGESISSADDSQLIAALAHSVEAPGAGPVVEHVAAPEVRRSLRSIRLSVDLLDRMMSGVSDMVLARNELARRLREAPGDVAVDAAFERVSGCIAEMRDAITRTRMQRIDNLFIALPRMVRDLADELGKQVVLDVDGGDVELDREMIEMIRDPLTHMIRNAVDHGIESPADRLKVDKPVEGRLRVSARQAGNQILIEIADDGRGIDGDRLARKAVAAGLISAEAGERLSPAQRYALIFEPGLSTATGVTAVSGRGVGMDVVRANVERIGGVVEVESKPGQGVRFTLRVPLTLTIIPALTVSAGGCHYAIPRSAIEEIVRTRTNGVRIEAVAGARVASIRDKRIPLVSLAEILGVRHLAAEADQTMIVLKPAGGDPYALAVDLVHDHEELVVKPAAPLVMATGLYAGTTLADDGVPILLLDASGLATAAGVVLDQSESEARGASGPTHEETADDVPALLFRTFAGARRAIRLAVVERIEDVAPTAIRRSAGVLRIAIEGRILPLVGLDEPPIAPVRILRLSDGDSELAYAFLDVVDLVTIGSALQPSSTPGEVAGVTLIGGEQVEVIDTYWLFGTHGRQDVAEDQRPLCALAEDDPWMANILRPMVEGAGYRVVDLRHPDAARADVLIAAAEQEATVLSEAAVLKIRSDPEPANENDDSIYRYDRAGLLQALRRPGAAPARKTKA